MIISSRGTRRPTSKIDAKCQKSPMFCREFRHPLAVESFFKRQIAPFTLMKWIIWLDRLQRRCCAYICFVRGGKEGASKSHIVHNTQAWKRPKWKRGIDLLSLGNNTRNISSIIAFCPRLGRFHTNKWKTLAILISIALWCALMTDEDPQAALFFLG